MARSRKLSHFKWRHDPSQQWAKTNNSIRNGRAKPQAAVTSISWSASRSSSSKSSSASKLKSSKRPSKLIKKVVNMPIWSMITILTTNKWKMRETFGLSARCGARVKCDISHVVTANEIGITSSRTRASTLMTIHLVKVILSMCMRFPTWQPSKNLSVSYSFGAEPLQSSVPPFNWSKSLKMCSKRSRFKAAWSRRNTSATTTRWSVHKMLRASFSLTTNTSAAGIYILAYFWSILVSLCHYE